MPKKLDKESLGGRADSVYGGRYLYKGFVKKPGSSRLHAVLFCSEHGNFLRRGDHILRGVGCPKCGDVSAAEKRAGDTRGFIKKASVVHGARYNYRSVSYRRAVSKVKIVCREHGVFFQTPNDHLNGYGCMECCGRRQLTTSEFIDKARVAHGHLYDYSAVEYECGTKLVAIRCARHGVFFQTPKSHMKGNGCPTCMASTGELAVRRALDSLGVHYKQEFKIDTLVNPKTGRQLRFDFWLPGSGSAIEFDGAHHYRDVGAGWEGLDVTKSRDQAKNTWCIDNGVSLLRIPYWEKDNVSALVGDFVGR